ncbi:MAG: ABC transporter permease [Solirubrobacteraceae bacterium]
MRLVEHWRVASGIARRGTKAWITSPPYIVITLLFPLLFFAAFAGALSALGDLEGFGYRDGYSAFVYGFVILQGAAFGGIFTGYSVARDFDLGMARRLLVGTAHRGPVIAGYVGVAVIRALIAMAALTAVALATGMRTHAGIGDGVLLVVCVCLTAAAACLWACSVAMRGRTTRVGPFMYTPILVVLFLTPVYVPTRLLGGWLRWLINVNPATLMVDGTRALVAGSQGSVGRGLAWWAGICALLAVWALRAAYRAPRL